MSNESNPARLIASVSLVLPNRQVDGRWQAGIMVLAGKEIPTKGLDQSHIDGYLAAGTAYLEGQVPQLKDVQALRNEEAVNVSSRVKASGDEENPLDDGIELVAGDDDPALDAKLSEIASKQQADGIENDGSALHEDRMVEVNAETGEVSETGGEPEFEEEADSQVTD